MLPPWAVEWLAIGVLAAAALMPLAVALLWVRRSRYTPAQSAIYGLNELVARVLWRAEVRGQIALPREQGAVVVCNHQGPLDSAFIQLRTGQRVVHWMVAKEYCEHPGLAWFFRICEAIPVGRGGIDTAATKMAIRYAQEGGLVGIFPEGRINTGNEPLLSGRPGALMIALKGPRASHPVLRDWLAL